MLFVGLFFSLLTGCKNLTDQEIYQRPDWLPGKLYSTILVQENLSLFAECLQHAGLDTIIDVSGCWSVFAPTNEAIEQYLSENQYASISDIPTKELEKIAEFHIIQNPWSLEQLKTLSAFGWREREDGKVYSYAYKRMTMNKDPIDKYWIKKDREQEMIVLDSTISNGYKKVFVETRKNTPIFYDAYLNVNQITSGDYNFYFDRPYEYGNVFYAGAKILQSDILAENGFVHVIDRVVNPMLNAKQILERELPGESYKRFLEMVYWYYPSFEENMIATNRQPGVSTGGQVDTLWDLNYYDLSFAPHQERIGYEGPNLNETWVNHNGLFASTDDAFGEFIDGILTVKSGFPHWRDSKSLPEDVVDILIKPHFKSTPIYPSTDNYKQIFKSNKGFKQNEEDIIRKEFASNSTFIGLKSYVPDRVFTSVTGPVFLRPSYSIFRRALLYCDIEDNIAYKNGELYFFPIPDFALKADSSLVLNWIDKESNRYNFMAFDRDKREMVVIGKSTLKDMILNHAGTPEPIDGSNIQRIKTLKNKTITWDHSNNTIRGSKPCTYGYNGREIVICTPVVLEEPADNGKSWRVNTWFNF